MYHLELTLASSLSYHLVSSHNKSIKYDARLQRMVGLAAVLLFCHTSGSTAVSGDERATATQKTAETPGASYGESCSGFRLIHSLWRGDIKEN